MGLTAKASSESSFKPVPAGMHLARCYRIIDLGTQTTEWQGKEKKTYKIMMLWEVHGEDDQGVALVTDRGEQMSISKNYTMSLGEMSSLRADLKAWRGRDFTAEELRGFQLKNVLGAWCMLTVSRTEGQNGKEYSNVVTVNPVPASIKKAGLPDGFNDLLVFDLDNPDMALFDTFSEKLKAKIQSSPEWKAKGSASEQYQKQQNASAFSDDDESDIPF
jgi:hypothetical protein